jgi:hypothetical protein
VIPSAKAAAAASDVSRKALLVESLKSSIIRANMNASIQKISLQNEMTMPRRCRASQFSY